VIHHLTTFFFLVDLGESKY